MMPGAMIISSISKLPAERGVQAKLERGNVFVTAVSWSRSRSRAVVSILLVQIIVRPG